MGKGLAASHNWILEHGDQYRGLWVMVCKGELLGAAPCLSQLKAQQVPGVLIHKIPKGGDVYEYVALNDTPTYKVQHAYLIRSGWVQWMLVPWSGRAGRICILRKPKDEPRMWTEGEIQKIMVMSQPGPRADGDWLGPPLPDSVLNERAMQADLIGRLERRNAELQAAIDEVVAVRKERARHVVGEPTAEVVERLLYSLATKEETNG